jgi:cellulose synthase operon protein C
MKFGRLLLAMAVTCAGAGAQAAPDDPVKAFIDELRAPHAQQQAAFEKHIAAEDDLVAGRYREAEEAFRALDDTEGVGRVYLKEGRKNEAIRLAAAELAAHPNNHAYRLVFANVAEQAGDLEALRQAHALLPDDKIVALALARELDANGQADKALTIYRAVLGGDPRDPAFADQLGWIYLRGGRMEQALQVYEALTTSQPNSSTYRYHYGMALLRNGEQAQAEEQLQRALELNPPPEERQRIQDLLQVLK